MTIARRRAAARNGLAAILVVLAAIPPAAFAGEGGQNFVLPLVTALAVASAAHKVPQQVGVMQPGGRPLVSLIPSQVQFEDGYEIDVNDYIGRRDPKSLVDTDRIVAYDVLHRRRNGWMLSFAYDTEHRTPLRDGSEIFRCLLDYRF